MNRIFSKYAVRNNFYYQRLPLIRRTLTHYEVLNLSKTCSQSEIKDSYIKLSKKYHPDKSADKDSHAKFIKIVAAYDVLSKPTLRRDYDLGLTRNVSDVQYPTSSQQKDPWDDPLFWKNRQKEHNYTNNSYYGIAGLKKVSNFVIVLICLCITSVGVGLQVLTIRNSVTLKREALLRRSAEVEEDLREMKEMVNTNGNLVQLELLKKRLNVDDTSD